MFKAVHIAGILIEGEDFDLEDIISSTPIEVVPRIACLKVWSVWQTQLTMALGPRGYEQDPNILEWPDPRYSRKLETGWNWVDQVGVPMEPTPGQVKRQSRNSGPVVGYTASVYLNRKHAAPIYGSKTIYHRVNQFTPKVSNQTMRVETLYFILKNFTPEALQEAYLRNKNRQEDPEFSAHNYWFNPAYNPLPDELVPIVENEQGDPTPEDIMAASKLPRITITYGTVTPESAAAGDYAEHGYEDEEGVPMMPDQWDIEDGLTAADLAVKFLKNKGATQASSSHFHPGVWYSDGGSTDFHTGEITEYSYHLEDFSPEDEKRIWDLMHVRR